MAGRTFLSIFDEGTSKGNSLLGDSVFSASNKSDGVSKEGLDSILKEINSSFNGFFQQQRDLKSDSSESSTSSSSDSSVSSETYAELMAKLDSADSSETESGNDGDAFSSQSSKVDADMTQFDAKSFVDSIGITASDSFTKMLNEENRQSAEIARSTNIENKTSSSVDDGLKTLYSKIEAVDSALAKNAEHVKESADSMAKVTSNEDSLSGGGWLSGFTSMIGTKLDSLFGGDDEKTDSEAESVPVEEIEKAVSENAPTVVSSEEIEKAVSENAPTVVSSEEIEKAVSENAPTVVSSEDSSYGGGWLSGFTSMFGSKIDSIIGGSAEKENDSEETAVPEKEETDGGGWFYGLSSMIGSKMDTLFGGDGETADEDGFDGGIDPVAVDKMAYEPNALEVTDDATPPTVLKSEPIASNSSATAESGSAVNDISAKIDEMRNAIVSSISALAETQKTTSETIMDAIGGIGVRTAEVSESQTVVIKQPSAVPTPKIGRIGIL